MEYIWEPRHFNRLFRKEMFFVFSPKKWSWNIFGNLAILTAY